MFGRKEIVGVVNEVQNEVVGMKGYVDSKFEAMGENIEKTIIQALDMRFKVIEQRINRRIDGVINAQSNNVLIALDKREEDKERRELRQKIKNNLSVIYTEVRETELFEKSARGNKKLTAKGNSIYNMLYETVMLLSKYHGSKSHMKIANRRNYDKFEEMIGTSRALTKKVITLNDGVSRESVFADMFYRGIVDKFTKFLEDEFLGESEAI